MLPWWARVVGGAAGLGAGFEWMARRGPDPFGLDLAPGSYFVGAMAVAGAIVLMLKDAGKRR